MRGAVSASRFCTSSASSSGLGPSRCSFSITWSSLSAVVSMNAGIDSRPASFEAHSRRAPKLSTQRPDACKFGRTGIGWRTPRSRIVSDSPCRALASNSRRGCSGFPSHLLAKIRPTPTDRVGVTVSLAGMAIIMFEPRESA
jgi:hypothetical protein